MESFQTDQTQLPDLSQIRFKKITNQDFEIQEINDDNRWIAQIARRYPGDFWEKILREKQIIQIQSPHGNFHYQPVLTERPNSIGQIQTEIQEQIYQLLLVQVPDFERIHTENQEYQKYKVAQEKTNFQLLKVLDEYKTTKQLPEENPNSVFPVQKDGTMEVLNRSSYNRFFIPESTKKIHLNDLQLVQDSNQNIDIDYINQYFKSTNQSLQIQVYSQLNKQYYDLKAVPIQNYYGLFLTEISKLKEIESELKQNQENIYLLMGGIAHDVKNSLQGITNSSDIINEKINSLDEILANFNDESFEQLKSNINNLKERLLPLSQRSMTHFLKVIDLFNKLQGILINRMERHPSDFNPVQICEDLHLHYQEGDKKHLQFKVRYDSNLSPNLNGEEGIIREVLENLIKNSYKFTYKKYLNPEIEKKLKNSQNLSPEQIQNLESQKISELEKGKIMVSITKINDDPLRIRFQVNDNGPGMSEEDLKRLFFAYSQGKEGSKKEYGGKGLGLFMSQTLIRSLNSKIQVESKLGEGSCFYFDLEMQTAENEQIEKPILHLENLNLLLVDDNEFNRANAMEFFRNQKNQIKTCANERETFDELTDSLIEDRLFDAIIMDRSIGKEDGLEIAHKIRTSLQNFENIPILLFTGSSCYDDIGVQSSLESGDIKNWIPKNTGGLTSLSHNIFYFLPPQKQAELLKKFSPKEQEFAEKLLNNKELISVPSSYYDIPKDQWQNIDLNSQFQNILTEDWHLVQLNPDKYHRIAKLINYENNPDNPFYQLLKSIAEKSPTDIASAVQEIKNIQAFLYCPRLEQIIDRLDNFNQAYTEDEFYLNNYQKMQANVNKIIPELLDQYCDNICENLSKKIVQKIQSEKFEELQKIYQFLQGLNPEILFKSPIFNTNFSQIFHNSENPEISIEQWLQSISNIKPSDFYRHIQNDLEKSIK
ncbi:MAG TPA: ATP-binding protein [Candidatus Gracilibacteria bacterium]|nr:ATP-binding protein [Candidatus Gracilibacteria bacterium]